MDAICCKRAEAIRLADDFLKSVFLDIFADPVTNPKQWPDKPLGNLLSFLTSGSRGWAKYYSDAGKLFLRIQNVGHNRLLMNDVAYVSPPDSAEARRTLVQPNDVLLSITADLGRTAVISEGIPEAYINQHLALLRPKDIEPLYPSAFLSSLGGQTQIHALNRNGVKAGLNFSDIRSLRILLPPQLLQRRFVLVYEKHKQMLERLSKAMTIADELFESLVQSAFRGEL
jgi:type I restriction enzyme S subunit